MIVTLLDEDNKKSYIGDTIEEVEITADMITCKLTHGDVRCFMKWPDGIWVNVITGQRLSLMLVTES